MGYNVDGESQGKVQRRQGGTRVSRLLRPSVGIEGRHTS